jgi:hypothetical protein
MDQNNESAQTEQSASAQSRALTYTLYATREGLV